MPNLKVPNLREVIDPPEEVIQAALHGELILFVGAGASRLIDLPSWKSLANLAFKELCRNELLNFSEIEQLKVLEPRKQLSIAKLIANDNDTQLNLHKHFPNKSEHDTIYQALNDIGCTCVTTNYDLMLSPRFNESGDNSTTASPRTRICEANKVYPQLLDDPGNVIHLHGCITKPGTMIVTTKDYLKHYDNENIQAFLNDLFARKTVVFIGYGLEEAEILEHILRRGSVTASNQRKRFALQGFFESQYPLYSMLHRYYKESFGVELLGFLRDHIDYNCQIRIIEDWSSKLQVNKPPLATDVALINEVFSDE